MLEAKFEGLIKKFISIENPHCSTDSEGALLSRDWEFILEDFDGWVILHVRTTGYAGYWIHPVLYPESEINDLKKNLPSFNVSPSSVAYSHVVSGSDEHWIEPFWDKEKGFNKSEIELFFFRRYEGNPPGQDVYYEFNQLVTHPLELHWSERKNSYCSLDEMGEEIEKIKIIFKDDIKLILIHRKALDKLLYFGKWVLVRYIIFSRWGSEKPPFDLSTYENYEINKFEATFRLRKCGKERLEYVEFRGAQIIRPLIPKEKLLSWSNGEEEEEEKQYAKYTVWDWKNNRLLKNYCIAPSNFSNYFVESDSPYEISPIFFKAEVLDKYKGNLEKYGLKGNSISCRGGWHLETYGVNDHNQVHTYAIYLARLPYKEQLHWCQYNEEPKGGISELSFQRDFEGKWMEGETKIERLKNALEVLSEIKVKENENIWSPKGGSWALATRGLHPVLTENSNQWHDFIIALANTTIEGLQKKPLKALATEFGEPSNDLGTLGLIKYILEKSGEDEKIEPIHGALKDLQNDRSKGKVHGNWVIPEGSLIVAAENTLERVIMAIEFLTSALSALK